MAPLALILALAAADAPGPHAADARCAHVLSFIGSRAAPAASTQSAAGVLYFLGKMRGREPGVDVDAVVQAAGAAARQSGTNPQTEVRRCIAELRSTDAVTARLQSRAAQPAQPNGRM